MLLKARCRCRIAVVVAAFVALPLTARAQHHELGHVSFPTSCNPAVQADFETGVAMLHSYWFNYAGKQFRAVLEKDPGCAMAYWGIALDMQGNTLSSPPSAAVARQAWELLEKARGVEVKTERERMWIDAIRAYFRDHDKLSVEQRLTAYNTAMQQLAGKFPGDFEAQVYYALTLQASAPKGDLTYANQYKSTAMLEKLYAQQPQHPGITHYLIHGYDFAPFADKGIPAARRYASIAPAVPHARHMPAHIYSMVGLWQDSITSNMSALEIQPDYYHAADFTVYAHLQLAQDATAARLIEKAVTTPERGDRPPSMANYTAKASMPARYVLERADWRAAAKLPLTPTEYPQADSLTHFTRGLGLARLGDRAGANREIDAMQRLRAAMEKSGDRYWADRTNEQIQAVSAWAALSNGARDQAIALMRKAADGEDASIKHVAMENRLYPMRELLGDLLLEAGRPVEALIEFTSSLKQYPNRYRGLYGAARAAEASGNAAMAKEFYAKVIELSKNAEGNRPELQRAQKFVGSSPPDFSGIWNSATTTPIERPAQLKDKAFFTAEEADAWDKEYIRRNEEPAPGAPRIGTGTYNGFYREWGTQSVKTRRTSIITDPPDGRIPALTPAAAEVKRQRIERLRRAENPEDLGLQDQCLTFLTSGPPLLPYSYNSNYQIIQAKDVVVVHAEMIHDARIVYVDGRPHPSPSLRFWAGHSVGRWEGNTLVVDTTNFNDGGGFYGDAGGNFGWDRNLHLIERFSLLDSNTLLYQFEVDNPTAFTQRWKGELTMTRATGNIFEFACHEGNYSLENMMRGYRATERKLTKPPQQ